MANMENILALPYAQWLEQTLQEMVKIPVKGIYLNAITEQGDVYTSRYEISMMDKIKIAGLIQQDAMIESLAVNGFINDGDEEEEDEE